MSWYWPPKDPSAPSADLLEIPNLGLYITHEHNDDPLRESGVFVYCNTHLAPPYDTFQCGPIVVPFPSLFHDAHFGDVLSDIDSQAVGTGVGPNYDWYIVVPGIDMGYVSSSTQASPDPTADNAGCWSSVLGHVSWCKGHIPSSSTGQYQLETSAWGPLTDIRNLFDGAILSNLGSSDTGHEWIVPNTDGGGEAGTGRGGAYVCPDPQFAVPDSHGNEAGMLLWTRAQLDEITSAGATEGGDWGLSTSISYGISLQAFQERYHTTPPPPPGPWINLL